jgi:hypothetical protein
MRHHHEKVEEVAHHNCDRLLEKFSKHAFTLTRILATAMPEKRRPAPFAKSNALAYAHGLGLSGEQVPRVAALEMTHE